MARASAADLYIQWQPMIWKIIHGLHAKYGTDKEEMRSQADVEFMRAFNSYFDDNGQRIYNEDNVSSFQSWMYTKVWGGLMDMCLSSIRRERMLSRIHDYDFGLHGVGDRIYSMECLVAELGEDGREIISLLFSRPGEIHDFIVARGDHTNRNMRSGLKDYLQRRHGWSRERIAKTFREIQGALS